MGNVLSAQIPNQILPVEAYLTDIADVQFVERQAILSCIVGKSYFMTYLLKTAYLTVTEHLCDTHL